MKVQVILITAGLLFFGPLCAFPTQGESRVTPTAHYSPDFDAQYSVIRPTFVYRGNFDSWRTVDFNNFTLHTLDERGKHLVCGGLHSGNWHNRNGFGQDDLTLERFYPLKSEDNHASYVLVVFAGDYIYGSSESDGWAQVWKLEDGTLRIAQQIYFNTHFRDPGPFWKFDAAKQELTARASHYLDLDAHCISAYDELTFAWTGRDFRLRSKKVYLTDFGKSHGRTLPGSSPNSSPN